MMLRRLLSPFRTVVAVAVALLATWTAAWTVTVVAWRNPGSPFIEGVINRWSTIILAVAGVSLTVRGVENIEPGRSYVIVSNHQSSFDIPAHFLALPMPIRFFAKKELFRIPIFGTALRAIGIVEVDRHAGAVVHQQINSQAAEVMRRGHSILVFAEGTRYLDGQVRQFKRGAFSIAIASGLPILPVVVNGGHLAWPKRHPILGGPITVMISKPIETSALVHKDVPMLRDQTKDEIERMIRAVG
ncbi:MAG: lysophospholipid acyltransferase family protein [Acidimicrobiia bacterium]|nr:lysophospholipid acyltransferase family protein [Acidimicrobiia bacterium]